METLKIAFTDSNLLSGICIVFALAAYFSYDLARNHTSALLELKLKESIDLAKRRLATARTESRKRLATAELLSAYNQVCIAYLNKQILSESFQRSYRAKIEHIVNSEEYDEFLQASPEDYIGIFLVHEKFKNRKRGA